MSAKKMRLATAIAGALLACAAQISLAAATVAPPDDEAAALNNMIANCNKAEETRFQAQSTEFQRDRAQNERIIMEYQGQNEALKRDYDDLRADHALLQAQYDDERHQNNDLQQKYQDMQQQLQDAERKYDDIVKAQTPPPPTPGLIDKLKGIF